MTKRYALSFTLLLLSVFILGGCTPEKIYNAQNFTLENGLEVVVVENHRAPVVAYALWVKAGAADEIAGQTGVAHFLEHLMFKGTPNMKPGEYSRKMRSWGANENAFTSHDYTAYFATIGKDNLENALALEGERLQNLAPPLDHVESERLVVIEERRQRTENDPRAAFFERLEKHVYGIHPYGKPIIGWPDDMENLDWPRSKAFIDRWYSPSNMALIFSGDITVDEAKTLAQKYFALKNYRIPSEHKLPKVKSLSGHKLVKETAAAIQQPVFVQKRLAPNYRNSKKTAAALMVLQDVVAGNAASQFYQSLVVEQKIATAINVGYDPLTRSTTEIIISASPAENIPLEQLHKQIDLEVTILLKKGVKKEDVVLAKKRLIESAAFARDSVMGPAMEIGRALATGATLEEIETLPATIQNVTMADIKKALGLLAPSRGSVTGYLEKGGAP